MNDELIKIDQKLRTSTEWKSYILKANEASSDKVIATFVNPFSYPILLDRPELLEPFNFIFSDGALHTKLHNVFCSNQIDRVSFDLSSIAKDVLERAQRNSLNVAIIGGRPEHVAQLKDQLYVLFPDLNICYCRDGYFTEEQNKLKTFTALNISKPDIVLIGMGTPLQEEFLLECVKHAPMAKEFYTCGGFLEQTATKGDYYHPLVKKFGLRWLQRAVMHSHVRRRLIKDYPKFIFNYCYSHLRGK